MTKHTPGPWETHEGQWADHSEDGGGGFHLLMGEYAPKDGIGIISARLLQYGEGFYPDDNGYEEVAANARLIAAAPELLDALVRLENVVRILPPDMDEPNSALAQARAALAKAGA